MSTALKLVINVVYYLFTDYAGILDRVVAITHVNMDRLKMGNSSYGDQFVDAMNVNGGDIEGASAFDYILHFITFAFKVHEGQCCTFRTVLYM